jgi:hypothetical protein
MSTVAPAPAITPVPAKALTSTQAPTSSPPSILASGADDHHGDWIGLQIWLCCALLIVALHIYDFVAGLVCP